MPVRPNDLLSPLSVLMCQPLLAALGSENAAVLKPIGSLPVPCFQLPERRTIVAATPINKVETFRAEMIATAIANNVDVALVRHGSWPETIDELSVDVVLGRGRPGQMLWLLFPYARCAALLHVAGWKTAGLDGAIELFREVPEGKHLTIYEPMCWLAPDRRVVS